VEALSQPKHLHTPVHTPRTRAQQKLVETETRPDAAHKYYQCFSLSKTAKPTPFYCAASRFTGDLSRPNPALDVANQPPLAAL